jgi:hypothetical protein
MRDNFFQNIAFSLSKIAQTNILPSHSNDILSTRWLYSSFLGPTHDDPRMDSSLRQIKGHILYHVEIQRIESGRTKEFPGSSADGNSQVHEH